MTCYHKGESKVPCSRDKSSFVRRLGLILQITCKMQRNTGQEKTPENFSDKNEGKD